MKKITLLLLAGFSTLAYGQVLTDSFDYASGTDINGLVSPGGLSWGSHNLAGNNMNVVSNSGLSYSAAGYSGYTESGNALSLDSTGAGSPWWAPDYHPSVAYVNNVSATLGNTVYGSFLVRRETWSAGPSMYLDSGALIGTGNGSYHAGLYVSNGIYTISAYDTPTQTFPSASTGKSSNVGQTDLIVFMYEQGLPGGEQRFSMSVNPILTGGPFAWDASVTAIRGASNFRTEFYSGHTTGISPAQITYDEIRFGSTLEAVTPVPEPATLGVLGICGLIAARRTRKK